MNGYLMSQREPLECIEGAVAATMTATPAHIEAI
jgi:hypothetical protein